MVPKTVHKLAQIGTTVQADARWRKAALDDASWRETAENSAQIDADWHKMTQDGARRHETALDDVIWRKTAEDSAQIGARRPNAAHESAINRSETTPCYRVSQIIFMKKNENP